MQIKPTGLQVRFVFVLLAAASIFALAAAAIAYQLGFKRALDSGQANLDSMLDAVEQTAKVGVYANDPILMREVVEGLARSPLAQAVVIVDPKGVTVLMSERGQPSADAVRSEDAVFVERRLDSPFDRNEFLGVLRIQVDMTTLRATARSEATVLALLMIGQTVLVAVLLYLLSAWMVSGPILDLAANLRRLKPGTATRLPVPSKHAHDEIGSLITSTNLLLNANAQALLRERELRKDIERMEAEYRHLFDASSAGIFVLSHYLRLINCNTTALRMANLAGNAPPATSGGFIEAVFADPKAVLELIEGARQAGQTVSADLELRHSSNQIRWVHCLISVQPGREPDPPSHFLVEGVMYDVTDRKHAEGAIRHRAEHDALTGLKNRASADASIDRMLAEAGLEDSPVSVLYIDLDGFKQVNDVHGHKAGDRVLAECARRMRHAVRRGSDLCARIGGDEFVVALANTGPEDDNLSHLAATLLDSLSSPIRLDNGEWVTLGASVGMACFPYHGFTRKQILHQADTALYEVKRTGKNSYAIACLPDTPPDRDFMSSNPMPLPLPSGLLG